MLVTPLLFKSISHAFPGFAILYSVASVCSSIVNKLPRRRIDSHFSFVRDLNRIWRIIYRRIMQMIWLSNFKGLLWWFQIEYVAKSPNSNRVFSKIWCFSTSFALYVTFGYLSVFHFLCLFWASTFYFVFGSLIEISQCM